MELKDILAISGQAGLFKYIARSTNKGVIVESLIDQRRTNASASAKISALAEISIYTDSEEIPLWQVLNALYKHQNGAAVTEPKKMTDAQLQDLFGKVLPDYNRELVHISDMRKLFGWYNVLIAAGMTDFTVKEEEND